MIVVEEGAVQLSNITHLPYMTHDHGDIERMLQIPENSNLIMP